MVRHLLTIFLLVTAVSLQAAVIDVSRACQLASGFYQELHGTSVEMQVVAQDTEHTIPAYYVCQPLVGEGYFIIPGVDAAVELLAYSDVGSFSDYSHSHVFRQLLLGYADRLIHQEEDGLLVVPSRVQASQPTQTASKTIAPLCQTLWHQSKPYNNLCPERDGQRSLTGCTATAMAMLMYYHRYPETPVGSGSATLSWEPLEELDFTQYTFDWDNMLTQYNEGEYTDQQAEAVATLMLLCGYGVHMNYSPSGSGANSPPARSALIQNFGYSNTARLYMRDSYEREHWLEMIRAELEAGRPILYSGRNSSYDGHTFVCDGMGLRNTIHINWGWGDDRNANVDVDVLAPRGYEGNGYCNHEEMLLGLKPQQPDEDRTDLPLNLVICDSLSYNSSNHVLSVPAIYNLGPERLVFVISLEIKNQDEVVDYVTLKSSIMIESELNSPPLLKELKLPELVDGDYSARLVIRKQSSDVWVHADAGDRTDGFTFSIVEGNMNFGSLTGIDSPRSTQSVTSPVYTLLGQRTTASNTGLVIRQGKLIWQR